MQEASCKAPREIDVEIDGRETVWKRKVPAEIPASEIEISYGLAHDEPVKFLDQSGAEIPNVPICKLVCKDRVSLTAVFTGKRNAVLQHSCPACFVKFSLGKRETSPVFTPCGHLICFQCGNDNDFCPLHIETPVVLSCFGSTARENDLEKQIMREWLTLSRGLHRNICCHSCSSPASLRCTTCSLCLCVACSDSDHDGHGTRFLKSVAASAEMCRVDDLPMMYLNSTGVSGCLKCFPAGEKVTHVNDLALDLMREKFDEQKKLYADYEEASSKLKTIMQQFESLKGALGIKGCQEKIAGYFDPLFQQVESQKKELLASVEKDVSVRLHDFRRVHEKAFEDLLRCRGAMALIRSRADEKLIATEVDAILSTPPPSVDDLYDREIDLEFPQGVIADVRQNFVGQVQCEPPQLETIDFIQDVAPDVCNLLVKWIWNGHSATKVTFEISFKGVISIDGGALPRDASLQVQGATEHTVDLFAILQKGESYEISIRALLPGGCSPPSETLQMVVPTSVEVLVREPSAEDATLWDAMRERYARDSKVEYIKGELGFLSALRCVNHPSARAIYDELGAISANIFLNQYVLKLNTTYEESKRYDEYTVRILKLLVKVSTLMLKSRQLSSLAALAQLFDPARPCFKDKALTVDHLLDIFVESRGIPDLLHLLSDTYLLDFVECVYLCVALLRVRKHCPDDIAARVTELWNSLRVTENCDGPVEVGGQRGGTDCILDEARQAHNLSEDGHLKPLSFAYVLSQRARS